MIRNILKQYWGYDDFRPLQSEIIMSVLTGHDTLGLMPTGGGKSITFQVSGLALGGLTLVVTPLIALMKDQCDHLRERGIKAAAVYMGMTHQEVLTTFERVISDDYRFLYLSPERLETQLFQAKLQYMDVRLLVVDEAHCISQWGYDFRPPYLKIANVRQLLHEIRQRNKTPWTSPYTADGLQHGQQTAPTSSASTGPAPSYHVPCMALTATATGEVIEDIQDKLRFRPGAKVHRASFARPNLIYSVLYTEDKIGHLLRMLSPHTTVSAEDDAAMSQTPAAIIYVRSRKKTAEIAETLTRAGIAADFYHAGLKPDVKQQKQDAWVAGTPSVIVTTNAFGMGIDKPDVRYVFHLDLPPSIEEYFQEAGRAGRDGLPAEAHLLVSSDDKSRLQRHLLDEYPERDFIRHVYGRLASFFQIAIAAGLYNTFEFDIMRFCSAYHLAMLPVHYSLKLLDQAGYISYIEEPDRHSRLMFTTSREALYYKNNFDPECQRIMQALLRLYTGLFADYVYIREDEVMRYTGLDRQTLYDKLLLLTRFHVLHYIPARQKPAIMYLTPRLEDEELRIPHTIYEDRHARQEKRINAMIDYVEDAQECRHVKLLRYFGENTDHRCGKCDVCLSQGHGGSIKEEAAMIRQLIISKLQARGPLAPQQIISQIHHDPERVAEVMRDMVEQEEILLTDGVIKLN